MADAAETRKAGHQVRCEPDGLSFAVLRPSHSRAWRPIRDLGHLDGGPLTLTRRVVPLRVDPAGGDRPANASAGTRGGASPVRLSAADRADVEAAARDAVLARPVPTREAAGSSRTDVPAAMLGRLVHDGMKPARGRGDRPFPTVSSSVSDARSDPGRAGRRVGRARRAARQARCQPASMWPARCVWASGLPAMVAATVARLVPWSRRSSQKARPTSSAGQPSVSA